jgi:tRNA G18 (ribose-2'-O)-methylase SpoU
MDASRFIRIDDAGDPQIAGFTNIRERDLRRSEGRFIAEGTVVLRMLAEAHRRRAGFAAEAVLILENRLEGIEDILALYPDDIPVYVAAKSVMNAIAGFDIHRGVLALGRREEARDAEALLKSLPSNALVVAASGIANHDNIGAIFRNAAAFGANAILLDETCCDPLYRKALRVSVGSVLSIPYMRDGSTAEIITKLNAAGFSLWGLSPSGETDIRAIAPAERMALLTGTEGEGLPPSILASIRTARIAQAPGLDSLNAATATGIALFEIASVMGRI